MNIYTILGILHQSHWTGPNSQKNSIRKHLHIPFVIICFLEKRRTTSHIISHGQAEQSILFLIKDSLPFQLKVNMGGGTLIGNSAHPHSIGLAKNVFEKNITWEECRNDYWLKMFKAWHCWQHQTSCPQSHLTNINFMQKGEVIEDTWRQTHIYQLSSAQAG